MLPDDAADGSLQIDDRAEHAALEPPLGHGRKGAFHRVEGLRAGGREVETQCGCRSGQDPDLSMLVGVGAIEDVMYDLGG